jgi:MFS family permease
MMLLYGPSILQNAGIGSASDAIFFTIFLNLFILVATIIAFGLVQRFGRRQILMTGVAGMAIGHLLMAANFFRGGSPFVSLAAMALAAGSFTLSLAPVGWIVVSEIYPNRIRATALAVVCFLLYLASFLCAQFFPMITAACEERMGHPGAAYLIFAGICLSCVAFVWKWLPETKDLPLEKIGRFWLDRG